MLKDTDKIRPSSSKKKSGSKVTGTPGGEDADKPKVPRTPKTILEVHLVRETKELLGNFLEKISALDEAKFFLTPVTPDIAPDYLDVIKHPMDLGLVKEKLGENKYSIAKTFVKDVKLVFDNALAYNNKDDQVYKDALKLQKKFDKLWKDVEGHLEEWHAEKQAKEEKRREGGDADGKPDAQKEGGASSKKKVKIDSPAQKFLWEEKGGWHAACLEVVEALLAMEDAWPFEEPVDPKALKLADYRKIIKKPMDLGTVQQKLQDERYQPTNLHEEFYRDVLLTFDNALLYNDEGDEIWKLAEKLKAKFEDMWKRLNQPVKGGEPANQSSDKPKPPKTPRPKTVHKGGWECEICDDGGKLILCDNCGRGWHAKCLEVDSVKQLPDPWHCRECPGGPKYLWEQKGGWAMVCKELLGKLLKNKRVWPFENPVDAKALKLGDYKKIVKKPMDLGTVGTKLEEGKYTDLEQSGEEFYKDVVLTFDNALLYNNEGDEIWEHAASLKATFEELWSKVNAKLERLKKFIPEPKTPSSSGKPDKEKGKTDKGGKAEAGTPTPGTLSSKKSVKIVEAEPVKYVWEQKGGWAVVCKELLGKLLKNKRVWPFENPVDAKALKLGDYKKIVKKPMDLGTVGTKLEEGKYTDLEQSGEEFYKDVVLTFDNALLYNNEGDEIWEHAASLKATFEELWSKVLEPVAAKPQPKAQAEESAKASAHPKTPAGKAGMNGKEDKGKAGKGQDTEEVMDPNHKGGWECEICDDGGKLILCDACGRGWHAKCMEVSDLKNLPDPWYCRECPGGPKFLWQQKGGWHVVCKEILDLFFKDKRVWPFERPVNPDELGLDDYFKIVKKPMDLGTIDKKLRAGEFSKDKLHLEFYKEVSLVFDNAIKYNPKDNEIHQLAVDFKSRSSIPAQPPNFKCPPLYS